MGGSVGGSSHPQWQSWLAVPGNVCVSIVSGIFSLFICISLSALGASCLNVRNLPLKLTVRKTKPPIWQGLFLPALPPLGWPEWTCRCDREWVCTLLWLSLPLSSGSFCVTVTGDSSCVLYTTGCAHTGISSLLLYHGLNFMSCDTLNWCYTCLSSWFSS